MRLDWNAILNEVKLNKSMNQVLSKDMKTIRLLSCDTMGLPGGWGRKDRLWSIKEPHTEESYFKMCKYNKGRLRQAIDYQTLFSFF